MRGNMTEQKKPLDLDELFGQARAVKVRKNDRDHELIHLDALSPKQAVRFQKLQLTVNKLRNLKEGEITDGQAELIESTMEEMLSILCSTLPLNEMSFMEKTRVLTYYIEETQGKKVTDLALKKVRTGARSSRA